jgi:hypothetical protein
MAVIDSAPSSEEEEEEEVGFEEGAMCVAVGVAVGAAVGTSTVNTHTHVASAPDAASALFLAPTATVAPSLLSATEVPE